MSATVETPRELSARELRKQEKAAQKIA